ncbi:MAG: hypothetical protein O9302_00210 [Cyclobacteriaceae bacterium]|nr:hypothetical protein [Cytophagales bacterium]MCZ8326453.1 hypothetical protein [Cyclobacteriaceae bacterium]
MKPLGSEIFGTTSIRTDEYIMLAKTIVENGSTTEEASLEIQAIDDMLSMAKIRPIINAQRFTASGRLRKDVSLREMISQRIDLLIADLKSSK